MIQRHWSGVCPAERLDDYLDHLECDTFPALRALEGFLGVTVLRRDVPLGVEVQVVSAWNSLDAVRGFAGDEPERAVVPAVAREMLVGFDERVVHWEVVPERNPPTAGPRPEAESPDRTEP